MPQLQLQVMSSLLVDFLKSTVSLLQFSFVKNRKIGNQKTTAITKTPGQVAHEFHRLCNVGLFKVIL